MNFTKRYSKTLHFLLWLLFFTTSSFGHTLLHKSYLDWEEIVPGAELIIEDPLRIDPVGSPPSYAVTRHVRPDLIYGREDRSDVVGKYWWFKVNYSLFDEGATTPFFTGELVISHEEGGGDYEVLHRQLSTSGYAKLVIDTISASDDDFVTSTTDPVQIDALMPEDVRLELQMEVERFDFLSHTSTVSHTFDPPDNTNHNLTVNWDFVPGAESYEFEWAYVDAEVDDETLITDYFENAIRVEIPAQEYTVSITYPAGTIYFRVRPIGRFILDVNGQSLLNDYSHIKFGAWSTTGAIILDEAQETEFEKDLNWQFTSTFAEEGKSKKVITFFDDGLRSRQTQTNLNTEDVTLVSTSHYDVEGRATLNILPTPSVGDNMLFYKPDFNRADSDGNSYNRIHFDTDFGDGCISNAPGELKKDLNADNLGGAGYYFSDSLGTDDAPGFYKELIPDAFGYPMTQSRYLNDGTGRLAWQGGVGEFFQLGNGHETRYFYDDPSNFQLKRLFGSNVGHARHYKRNLVMDSNGQLSVSYIDAAGRVIATALTGTPPGNLEPLESAGDSVQIVENLMDNNNIDTTLRVSSVVTSIMNEFPGNVASIAYSVQKLTELISIPDCDDFCVGCQFELVITVKDPCGDLISIDPSGQWGGAVTEIVTTINGSDDCNALLETVSIQFDVTMNQVGNYTISKVLRIKEVTIESWLGYLAGCIPDLSDIPLDINYVSCAVTCEQTCREIIQAEQGQNYEPTEAEILNCMANIPGCNIDGVLSIDSVANVTCNSIITRIRNNIAPGGCLYIDNPDFWWGTEPDDLMELINNYDDFQTETFELENGYIGTIGDLPVRNALNDPAEWQEDWLQTLERYHPEYCYYLLCIFSQESREFDNELFLSPNYSNLPISLDMDYVYDLVDIQDPMFSPTGFYNNYNDPPELIEYVSSIENAVNTIANGNLSAEMKGRLDNFGICPESGPMLNIIDYVDCVVTSMELLSEDEDEVRWNMFRSLYLGTKSKLRNQLREEWCKAIPQSNNVCTNIIPGSEDETDIYEVENPNDDNGASSDNFIAENNINACPVLCESRVAQWVNEILIYCPTLSVAQFEPGGNLNGVTTTMQTFCEDNCNTYNPMAFLLTEHLNTSTIAYILGEVEAGGCDVTELFNEIAEDHEDVYFEPYEGNTALCFNIDDCLLELITFLNDEAFPANQAAGCPTIITVSSSSNCFSNVTIKNSSNEISPGILGNCCHFFQFYTDGGTIVNLCDIKFINNLRVEMGQLLVDITLEGQGKPVRQTVVLTCQGGNTTTLLKECVHLCYVPYDELIVHPDSIFEECVDQLIAEAEIAAENTWQNIVADYLTNAISQHNCLDGLQETFTATYVTREHHYTLYYYDQAGNLVQTVPPIGVNPVDNSAFLNGDWNGTEPVHEQQTRYQYNSLNQVVWQKSPDAGVSEFKYDFAQRLRVSQNAKQAANDPNNSDYPVGGAPYSYTKYDKEGRIVEVGEMQAPATLFENLNDSQLNSFDFPENTDGTKDDVTETFYNLPPSEDLTFPQQNLRGRVAATQNRKTDEDIMLTRYSYDAHGNVKSFQHELFFLQSFKAKAFYTYDLISGNVLQLDYQPGRPDQYYFRYEYDADNRLTYAFSSDDNVLWEREARYFYYAHGPLARMEVGHDNVQGMDYHYTLQGWIKGVNMPGYISHEYEPGLDGNVVLTPPTDAVSKVSYQNRYIARDEMSYGLGYYDGDYSPINSDVGFGAVSPSIWSSFNTYNDNMFSPEGLYNGNISWMVTDLPAYDLSGSTKEGLRGMAYHYDQLHRIIHTNSYGAPAVTSGGGVSWNEDQHYMTEFGYDANGNLKSLLRNGPSGQMDNLAYHYYDTQGFPNRLEYVDETASNNADYPESVQDTDSGNFSYDEIGNLVSNAGDGINDIVWDVYGKVESVLNNQGANLARYRYDPSGNRVFKLYDGNSVVGFSPEAIYIRDLSGNILSVYSYVKNIKGGPFFQKEVPLYGSSRLGQVSFRFKSIPLSGDFPTELPPEYKRVRNNKQYELSNHLGNVLAVVSDQKIGIPETTGDWVAAYYDAKIGALMDYYPFGMSMPNRTFNSPDYRYGFNGKEKDESGEFGNLTHYDYGFRIYNPGIGKFLSVDPLSPDYPELTPYQFASNTPIAGVDLDGLEFLDAEDAMINITSGGIMMKLENASEWTLGAAKKGQGVIDLENRVAYSTFPTSLSEGGIDYSKLLQEIDIQREGLAAARSDKESRNTLRNIDPKTGKSRVSKYPLKVSGNARQNRTYTRYILSTGGQPGGTKFLPSQSGKASAVGLIVGISVNLLNKYMNAAVDNDFGKAIQQLRNEGAKASVIVKNNLTLIPDDYRTNGYLNELTNFVFQGTLINEHSEEITKDLREIGKLILLKDDNVNCQVCGEGVDITNEAVKEFLKNDRDEKRKKAKESNQSSSGENP